MTEMGHAGVEEVSKHINGYFSKLIERIHHHGGDVLKFAGDALLCMFSHKEEDMQTLTLRAVQCGLDIQTDLQVYEANGVRLTLHIGLRHLFSKRFNYYFFLQMSRNCYR